MVLQRVETRTWGGRDIDVYHLYTEEDGDLVLRRIPAECQDILRRDAFMAAMEQIKALQVNFKLATGGCWMEVTAPHTHAGAEAKDLIEL